MQHNEFNAMMDKNQVSKTCTVLYIFGFFIYKLAPVEADTTDIVACEYVSSLYDLLCLQLSQVQSF